MATATVELDSAPARSGPIQRATSQPQDAETHREQYRDGQASA